MGSARSRTVFVFAAAAALVVVSVAPRVQAQDAVSGVGDSQGATSLLSVALGADALRLRVIGENSRTSNDPADGATNALERVTPLSLISTLVPALDGASAPSVETSSTGGEDVQTTPAVDLGALVAGSPVPGLVSGTIEPFALRSAVDAAGASSSANGATQGIAILGGLLSTGTFEAGLGSTALTSDSNAVRGLHLDTLEVLDLQALLDALGISLADLPLDAAIGLLDALGLPLPEGLAPAQLLSTINGLLTGTASARALAAPLQTQIDSLQAQLATATAQLSAAQGAFSSNPACALPVLSAACASLQAQIATLSGAVSSLPAQINSLVDQVQAALNSVLDLVDQLTDLLNGVLDGLEGASLLSVSDLLVGVTAQATDSVDTSLASVVGSVGDVSVGELSLGGLDGGAALGQVTALTDQVTGTLGGILGLIDPSLAGLVDVSVLQQNASVTEADGIVTAVAGITGLTATITPPDVCALLASLGAQDTVGSLLEEVGTLVPALPGPVGEVLGDLTSTVTCTAGDAAASDTLGSAALVDGVASAITQPLTVSALSVTGASTFSPVAVPGTPGAPGAPGQTPETLPVTGGEAWLALAAVLGAAGYGVRRVLVRSA